VLYYPSFGEETFLKDTLLPEVDIGNDAKEREEDSLCEDLVMLKNLCVLVINSYFLERQC
jgi:hypothetical protein